MGFVNTLTVYPSTGILSWEKPLFVARVVTVTVVIPETEAYTFDPLQSYAVTLKPKGKPSGDPIGGPWALTYVDERECTFEMDLGLQDLYNRLGDKDSVEMSFGLDVSGGGPLGFQASESPEEINNSNARPEDVSSATVGTPISAEQVTTQIASAIASVAGITPYDSAPEDLGTADPGDSSAFARGNHAHKMPSAADVGATPASHTSEHPAPTTRDARNYRAQTTAASATQSGEDVAPDFTANLTLQWTLTGNLNSFAAATGLADGETGMILITIGSYALPSDPPSGAYKGSWTVTGTLVRVIIERIGDTYLWSADSLEVVA